MATVFSTAFAGTATSLSSSYYMRRLYADNAAAKTDSSRALMRKSTLSYADSHALRRAIKNLGSFSYDDDHSTDIRNSVSAFVNTYNNLLDSSGTSSDNELQKSCKGLKKLTQEYADDLNKIGITVNKDGTLKTRTDLFANADISKFKELFSKDSKYMQRVSSYSKRMELRGQELDAEETQEELLKQQPKEKGISQAFLLPGQADAGSASPDLADGGIGSHINVVL